MLKLQLLSSTFSFLEIVSSECLQKLNSSLERMNQKDVQLRDSEHNWTMKYHTEAQGPWKICLSQNRYLVPKRMGVADLEVTHLP